MWKASVVYFVVLHVVFSLLFSQAFFSGSLKPRHTFSPSFQEQYPAIGAVCPDSSSSSGSSSSSSGSSSCSRSSVLYMSSNNKERKQENTLYQEVVEKMLYDNSPRAGSNSGITTTKVTSSIKEVQFGRFSNITSLAIFHLWPFMFVYINVCSLCELNYLQTISVK